MRRPLLTTILLLFLAGLFFLALAFSAQAADDPLLAPAGQCEGQVQSAYAAWPIPVPKWFWPWARWRLGEGEFKGHKQDPLLRPPAPRPIPAWAWRRLQAILDVRKVEIIDPPPPPIVAPPDAARVGLCYHNYAREQSGVTLLTWSVELGKSSQLKAERIIECNEFSHTPCGDPFQKSFQDAGFPGFTYGENIAWGYPTPRDAFAAYLASPGHRANIVRAEYRLYGEVQSSLQGSVLFVNQFGA